MTCIDFIFNELTTKNIETIIKTNINNTNKTKALDNWLSILKDLNLLLERINQNSRETTTPQHIAAKIRIYFIIITIEDNLKIKLNTPKFVGYGITSFLYN